MTVMEQSIEHDRSLQNPHFEPCCKFGKLVVTEQYNKMINYPFGSSGIHIYLQF